MIVTFLITTFLTAEEEKLLLMWCVKKAMLEENNLNIQALKSAELGTESKLGEGSTAGCFFFLKAFRFSGQTDWKKNYRHLVDGL